MSDLRRLIARMDQINEQSKFNQPKGLDVPPLEGPGGSISGGSTTSGPSPFGGGGAAPSVKPGPFGTTSFTSPPPRVTPSPRVNVDPNIAEIPAYQRAGKPEPVTVPKPGTKPSVTVKPGETMDQALQRSQTEKEFQQFLQGQSGQTFGSTAGAGRGTVNPPAVWKDPRSGKVSSSPPPANVEPPAPLTTKSTSPDAGNARPEPNPLYPPKDVSTSSPSILSQFKNLRKDAPLNPDYIEYPVGKTNAEKQAINLQKMADQEAYDAALQTPYFNPGLKSLAIPTVAALGGPYNKPDPDRPSPLDKYKGVGGNAKYMWDMYQASKAQDALDQQKANAKDQNSADKEPTKESLQNKLFKEFKTFIEKK